LDADNGTVGAFPYWEGGSGSSRVVSKLDIGDDREEGKAHFLIIRLEVTLNGDYKSGRDRGEQTGLLPSDLQDCGGCGKNAHEDQCGVQVFGVLLVKIVVMLVSCTLEPFVELGAGVAVHPGWQWFEYFILQAETTWLENVKNGRREVDSAYTFSSIAGSSIMRHHGLWSLDGVRERGESKESWALASPCCLHAA
jgi:hypothetical protein